MPLTPATSTSRRLLSLLSLLQAPRDWPGWLLADRLDISERTLRRDVDRLRELGYEIRATKGRDGGYRLDAGAIVPPMLFDDEQVVAIAIALQAAPNTGADIGESAARALTTVRQVLPSRLRPRVDAVELTPLAGNNSPTAGTDVLLAVGDAIRRGEELRFDHRRDGDAETDREDAALARPPRRVQPHHLVSRLGRWYVVGWDPDADDWRVFRADRTTPRTPTGPRFVRRAIPGGDVGTFLEGRFKGSADNTDRWPCIGDVILHADATDVLPFAHDGVVESLGPSRCRLRSGAWSWAALAAALCRFDVDIEVVGPPELRAAFADLTRRASLAAQ
ncbi:helix-turn-helix transcriptional regulator [Williamsia muralis]|uniref:Transcriptional regulator n=1 Tax=Williamsia marianensis TaxID=85044 RepID=A0A2G3PQS3_WILMA|nr:WYL domain-containing protein [Williamsia marianensis]PHV68063.1 transcriptional regulator [Williamsia marianensis]